jgi:SMC interacting uncharacterized protein involved in chromosome segregation
MASDESDAGKAAVAPGGVSEPAGPGSGVHLERFAKAFEASARRWELVVYPSLFAFIVLAAYGFFLVYSLTKDMRILSTNVDPDMNQHMGAMTASIERLSNTIHEMNQTVATMGEHIRSMDTHMAAMKADTGDMSLSTRSMVQEMERINGQMTAINARLTALDPIVANMGAMNESMKVMTVNIGLLSRDIGRPMNFMNQFAPW